MKTMEERAERFADKECICCNRKTKLEENFCNQVCREYARNVSLYCAIASEQRDADMEEFGITK